MLSSAYRPVCVRCRLNQIQPHQQTRAATLIKRPRRPYTFTQLVTLSDGSTFLQRTTSPAPIYRCTKDTRNSALWNPSSQKLRNIEEDEAGRLKKFRGRFGRGWDAASIGEVSFGQNVSRSWDMSLTSVRIFQDEEGLASDEDGSLLDLMTDSAQEAERKGETAGVREEKTRSGKGKGGEK